MERTPQGTSVGVDDPYANVDRCDHLTDDGRCRLALERPDVDRSFARARAADDYTCPVAAEEWGWPDCPQFRSRSTASDCARCGLEERRIAHEDTRPLLEEHHLSYADAESLEHEITVQLCRWCHSQVHQSWARIDDDVSPAQEAIAVKEGRRSRELEELQFESAAERREE
jgi:hypothetical protein